MRKAGKIILEAAIGVVTVIGIGCLLNYFEAREHHLDDDDFDDDFEDDEYEDDFFDEDLDQEQVDEAEGTVPTVDFEKVLKEGQNSSLTEDDIS